MMMTFNQAVVLIIVLWVLYGLVYFSILDHERQLKKARHKARMRGKLSVVEGGKSNEQHQETNKD